MGLKEAKKDIKDLIRMLQGTDVSELDIETEGMRLRIRRLSGQERAANVVAPDRPVQYGMPPATGEAGAEPGYESVSPDAGRGAGKRIARENHVTITAPMVGTFYRAPSPDAPPYVEIGSIVEPGQPVCIIEAMKIMNEILSEVRGRVVEILVENAQPVEYGQVLFVVEKV
ncbi:MAG TPA: acetyl-CoA carboxylase biotin carboxyl carrier protein [Firmicutes bacterium]|nr:acetyl-CoA carboxylase biotin carboxyl carrier protein [Bacillota bacterium]